MTKTIYQLLLLILGSQLAYGQNRNITISSTAGSMNNIHLIAGETIVHKGPTNNKQMKVGFHYTLPSKTSNTDFTFFSNRDTVQTGDTISVAIRVDNIPSSGIFSFEQTIQFDTSKLSYTGYTSLASMSYVGVMSDPTQIPIGYFLFNNALTDSTSILLLHFVVKMQHGEQTTFNLVSSPSSEVRDPLYNLVPYTEAFDTIFTINPAIIRGKIATETGLPMPYVAVVPSIQTTPVDTTDMMGNYAISTSMGTSLSIRPERKGDLVTNNGINILDIMTIVRYLQGQPLLNSPYKKIAANVGATILPQDVRINSLDLAMIQQVILGSQNSFGGEQYSFVPSTYNFPNGWYEFPDSIAYPAAQNLNQQDFIGIKLGDVTNDWNNNLRSLSSGPSIALQIDSSQVLPNEHCLHHISACGMQGISSFQMTITWDSTVAQLDSIIPNPNWNIQSNHYNAGTATFLFYSIASPSVNIPDGASLFGLSFSAIGRPGTSTALEINSSVTPLMVLDQALSPLTVQTHRGMLEISTVNSLPIKLHSFQVQKSNAPLTVDINWSTSMEKDAQYFVLEWSKEGMNFIPIKQIAAKGNSNHLTKYHYQHQQATKGGNYYRLKTIDYNGDIDYSPIRVITFDQYAAATQVYPNPFQDQLHFFFDLYKDQDISLKLINVFGQTIQKRIVAGSKGSNSFIWDLKENNIPKGNYLVVISIGNQSSTYQLIKN